MPEQIKVHLSAELKEKFSTKAKNANKTQSAIIRTLIHNYVKNEK